MKRNISIQLKASFLLIVFALNTIVGFACALGADMGFNSTDHHDDDKEKKVSIHVHANGKKHEHHSKKSNSVSTAIDAAIKKNHHHDETEKSHHNKKNRSGKDDCCNDKVIKITQTDKAVAHSNTLVHPVFFTAFISCYYKINVSYPSQVAISNKYFVRGHHPPILDVRIAIQRFQI